jgi:thiamine monophosphate synthase
MRFVKPALLAHEKWAPALQQVPIITIGGISVYWLLDRLTGLGG